MDGAQAVGQFPINLHDLGCDAYAASLHKWMLAPTGTGFLYIKNTSRDRIKSAFAIDTTLESPDFDPPGTKDFGVDDNKLVDKQLIKTFIPQSTTSMKFPTSKKIFLNFD